MLEESPDDLDRGVPEILAVIVLYKIKPSNSSALKSLMTALDNIEQAHLNIQILLFDNTPGGQNPGPLPDNVRYVAAKRNVGLAVAYNRALTMAGEQGLAWLLTVDQDTLLPPDYLVKMRGAALRWQDDLSVAAIVPQLVGGSCVLSPNYVRLLRNTSVRRGFTGLNEGELFALNSAALLRVTALREIGGFCEDFWLDQLDAVLYHQLHRAGKRIYVAGNIQVQHQLSLQDYSSLSPERLRNFLQAESAFFDLHKGAAENRILTATLLFRYFKHKLRGEGPATTQEILSAFRQRILRGEDERIKQWRRAVRTRAIERSAQEAGEAKSGARPRVSVCMATFNGEEFVALQLGSILKQLAVSDEVVVVDDASTDNTCKVIESMDESRIRLIVHKSNQGVLRTFEEAIQRAKGEILFLADQDDLWADEKVTVILDAFRSNPQADIVVSDALLIDQGGRTIGGSYYDTHTGFQPGFFANLAHCRYLGCTMAVHSRLLPKIMPFPKGADILHDLWIGALNSVTGGKTFYIDRPLVYYRRHEKNATGNRRLSLRRQIWMRWDLCRSLAAALFRVHLR